MFKSVRLNLGAVVAATVIAMTGFVMGGTASAATLNFSSEAFLRGQLPGAQTAMADFRASHTISNLHVETFEGYQPWGVGGGTQDLTHTKVGSFTPFGRVGNGNSVVGNGGQLQVRDDNHMKWGRYNTSNTTPLPPGLADGNWLDSNDNRGIEWRINGLGAFNTLAFFVIDAADVGGKFSIKIADALFPDLAHGGRLRNGNIHLVTILLPETVTDLTVRLMHNIHNDGFGIDGALVGLVTPSPAPVPLPPAALLLLPALGLLAGVRRLKRPRRA